LYTQLSFDHEKFEIDRGISEIKCGIIKFSHIQCV
jgi:hypothetical protein